VFTLIWFMLVIIGYELPMMTVTSFVSFVARFRQGNMYRYELPMTTVTSFVSFVARFRRGNMYRCELPMTTATSVVSFVARFCHGNMYTLCFKKKFTPRTFMITV